MQPDLFSQSKYKFFCLGSGSSGNCYYLGTSDYGILIDAGVGIRAVKKSLREYGVSIEKLIAVLVTHDHADHVKTIGCFGDKMNIPVYATQAVYDGIRRNQRVIADLTQSKRLIKKEEPFVVRDFSITAFDVPHDSIENVGFRIEFDNQVLVLVTDVGRITDTIRTYAAQANHLIMEANYDEVMLSTGRYPYFLKERIASGMGYISNKASAEFIASVYHVDMKNIWLCHLSQDNNHPELACKTVEQALHNNGVVVGRDVRLEALSRFKVSGLREF